MKRKLFVLLALIMLGSIVMNVSAQPLPIEFSVGASGPGGGIGNPYPGGNPRPKSEPVCPEVSQDGNILSFVYGHDAYTLYLKDEDGMIVYSAFVPSTVVTVILPSYLEGEFELLLFPDGCDYYFYGDIEL